MPSDSAPVQLGDLIEVKHGWPFKSELFSEQLSGKGIVVAIGNFRYSGGFRFSETACKEYRGSYPPEYELSPGDILLVMTCQTAGGEILGIPAKVPNDGRLYLHNQRIGKVVLKSDTVQPNFLYWLFLTPDFNRSLVSTASGTKILHTSPSRICDYHFRLPSFEVQCETAQVLDALQDRIALLRETNTTLEAIAQALFKSWFVDFDPVRAKAEGRDPVGVPPEVADLFPSEFEESALGEIPKGWRVGSFGEITDVVGGGTPSTKEPTYWEDGKHYWATPKDLSGMDTPVLLDTERKITDAGLAKISSGLLPVGTVLMSSRAPIGYLAIAEVPVAVNQGFIAMKPKAGISNLFLLDLLRVQMDEIKSHANGSTFMEISKAAFRPLKVVVPPNPVIQAFDDVARSLYERMVGNVRQIDSLTDLRDALLPRLMSGKLRIPDLQEAVAEAAP